MYIEPNTQIKLLSGVPLKNNYEWTLFFNSATEQESFFSERAKYNLTAQSYMRRNNGIARLALTPKQVYDCNYMMFKNSNFENKWFYAFINSVEYINNEVCEINFEIDVMQTWLFEAKLKPCFVEREHSATDEIGDNILPEPLTCGEYVYSDYKSLGGYGDMCVIIAVNDVNSGVVEGELYDGIYGGAELWIYEAKDVQDINSKIAEYVTSPDSILSIYMCDKNSTFESWFETHKIPYSEGGRTHIEYADSITGNEKFGEYTPKNKKLYTYPYNYLNVNNASGNNLAVRYEFFENNKPVFDMRGTITQPVKVICRPCSYKGVPNFTELGGYHVLHSEYITLENYPMCSWNVDAYNAWLAQNSVPIALNTASNISDMVGGVSGVLGLTSPQAMGISLVSNLLSRFYQASISADISKGNFNNGNINVSAGTQRFYSSRVHVTEQYAKMIDNYFNTFGYATNTTKIPNRNVRKHWTYTKTVGCIIEGEIPADDLSKICSIYDSGITFWSNWYEVGNYFLDNEVIENG